MKPSVVLLGFVLGSAAAITFALAGVAFVFALLRAEHPSLQAELPSLLLSLGMFTVLTALAGASFYGSLRTTKWRQIALGFLLIGLAAVGWFHWPG
jgi:Ca2+/Na+ antiporter